MATLALLFPLNSLFLPLGSDLSAEIKFPLSCADYQTMSPPPPKKTSLPTQGNIFETKVTCWSVTCSIQWRIWSP